VVEPVRTINARSGKISWNWTRMEDAHISYLLDRGEVHLNALTTTKAASVVEYIATRESIRKAASVCRTLSDEEIEIITSYAELNADEASYLRVLTFMLKEGLYDNCVLYLPFTRNLRAGINDDNTTVYDRSVFGNHGTIYGAVWQTLASGKSVLSYDGADDYVEVPHSKSLNITNEITIEAWVKHDGSTGWWNPIVSKDYDSTTTKGPYNFAIKPDNTVQFKIFQADPIPDLELTTTESITDGIWYHLVVTYDKTLPADNVKIYFNSDLKASANYTESIPTNTKNLCVGCYKYGPQYFHGIIDEVRIYSRALSEDEIRRLFNLTRVFYGV